RIWKGERFRHWLRRADIEEMPQGEGSPPRRLEDDGYQIIWPLRAQSFHTTKEPSRRGRRYHTRHPATAESRAPTEWRRCPTSGKSSRAGDALSHLHTAALARHPPRSAPARAGSTEGRRAPVRLRECNPTPRSQAGGSTPRFTQWPSSSAGRRPQRPKRTSRVCEAARQYGRVSFVDDVDHACASIQTLYRHCQLMCTTARWAGDCLPGFRLSSLR
ncbi:hypothetical protein DFH09DRAFT_1148908, partial [Mycena vulgaris]